MGGKNMERLQMLAGNCLFRLTDVRLVYGQNGMWFHISGDQKGRCALKKVAFALIISTRWR